jgi:hypothetical protein
MKERKKHTQSTKQGNLYRLSNDDNKNSKYVINGKIISGAVRDIICPTCLVKYLAP